MADNCKSIEKPAQEENGSNKFSSIGNILKIILSAFSLMKQPASSLPPPLIMLGARIRPGLSARDMAARVISRFSESGAVSGEIFQEGNNIMTALVVSTMEEVVSAIQTEAKVSAVIDPGAMMIQATGVGNLGAPVASVGTNINIVSGNGIIT